MSSVAFSQPELIRVAKLSITELTRVRECRHPHTRIDTDQDYGPLTPLVRRWDRTIHLDWISEQYALRLELARQGVEAGPGEKLIEDRPHRPRLVVGRGAESD